MKAVCLLAVFALAKIAILAVPQVSLNAWAPVAYLWQDVAVVLGFAIFERLVRPRWVASAVYFALVALAALNIPLERVLGTPLTLPMLHAARGTLSDSIRHEASALNLALGAFVFAVGAALPKVWSSRRSPNARWFLTGLALVALGLFARRHVDTHGLDRNVFLALARSAVPRVRADGDDGDWRGPLAPQDSVGALTDLRGIASGRNVLLVILESTAARYLQPYGAALDPMPHLTELAGRSIVFENAYAVYPESIKGLVAVLASRYPAFDVSAERHAGVMSPSLASVLSAAGYRTALFHSGRFMYLGMAEELAASGFGELEDAGKIGGNAHSSFGIDEPAAVHRVLQWIDEAPPTRRFLAAYLPIAGHHPYSFSGRPVFPGSSDMDRYRNALHEGDESLGVLLDGLRERGLADSTVIVVIGDHGEAFAQHPGNIGHDLALYEENVRVPFLIHVPGIARPARRAPQVVSLLDLAPTVLDLLGRVAPTEFQGESVLAGRSRAALFFTDYSLGLLGIRDGCLKDIYEMESHRSRMFDICTDPDERTDLAAGNPGRAAAYRERLQHWSADQVARVTAIRPHPH
jgi:lipoteichoic acid synthase